jgi:hypothetical protein
MGLSFSLSNRVPHGYILLTEEAVFQLLIALLSYTESQEHSLFVSYTKMIYNISSPEQTPVCSTGQQWSSLLYLNSPHKDYLISQIENFFVTPLQFWIFHFQTNS